MLAFDEINRIWTRALFAHGRTEAPGRDGKPFRPIGDKSLSFLEAVGGAARALPPDVGAMLESGKIVRWWSDPHFGHDNLPDIAFCPPA